MVNPFSPMMLSARLAQRASEPFVISSKRVRTTTVDAGLMLFPRRKRTTSLSIEMSCIYLVGTIVAYRMGYLTNPKNSVTSVQPARLTLLGLPI